MSFRIPAYSTHMHPFLSRKMCSNHINNKNNGVTEYCHICFRVDLTIIAVLLYATDLHVRLPYKVVSATRKAPRT